MKIVLLLGLVSFAAAAVIGATTPDREDHTPLVPPAIAETGTDPGGVSESTETVTPLRSRIEDVAADAMVSSPHLTCELGSTGAVMEPTSGVDPRPCGLVPQSLEAVRAWLPFQRFLEQQAIDASSVDEERLATLFERFLLLDMERNAELASVATAPVQLDPETSSSEAAADTPLVESIEARYAARESILARELGCGVAPSIKAGSRSSGRSRD